MRPGDLRQGDTSKVAEGKKRAEQALRELNQDLPIARGYPEVKFDREQAFVLYATFSGDIDKTAFALSVSREDVLAIAKAGEWQDRLAAIFALKQYGRPGEVERCVNRASNFAQASRMRMVFEKMVHRFYTMTDAEMDEFCFAKIETYGKGPTGERIVTGLEYKLNTRPFADFASALEKVHNLTYLALGDSAGERAKRAYLDDAKDETKAQDIHAAIAEAVSKAAGDQSPRALMFEEQLAQVKNVMEGKPETNPDHHPGSTLPRVP